MYEGITSVGKEADRHLYTWLLTDAHECFYRPFFTRTALIEK